MSNDLEILKRARSFFSENEGGSELQNTFASLLALLRIEIALKNNLILRKLHSLLYQAVYDLQNIGTTVHRLEWVKENCISNSDFSNFWMPYASSEIEFFHVQMRSVMDIVAETIPDIAEKRGQVPKKSFRKLIEWIDKNPGNRGRLGQDLLKPILSVDWFNHLRLVRDSIVHRGASTLVFGNPEDGVLFQVFDRNENNLIAYKYLMFNDNVGYFDRYAAIYISRLLIFIEDVAELIKMKFEIKDREGKASIGSIGFHIIQNWIDNLIKIIEKDLVEASFKKILL